MAAGRAAAQVPEPNVNMVSGTEWPGGDPFLQRQNEPSMAVSSRNPLHILAGANDYRTVDLPGLPDGGVTGDAWLGLFKSTDGGARWTSTLLPGYPQDHSPAGLASPLKGFAAAADAVMKPGANGLFYFGGLAFNRGENVPSAIFVARYLDRNNRENGDPFAYQGTRIIARNAPGEFLDKPALAVDIPRPSSGHCEIDGVSRPTGAVYAAWTVFLGSHPHSGRDDRDDDDNEKSSSASTTVRSRIMFSRSLDCGRTWRAPVTLSDSRTNQGASIAIDPRNGHIYVAWRQFETWGSVHAILVARSIDGGRTFTRPAPIWGFFPFDQGTSATSFRTNSYPSLAVDHTGRVYAAWAARGYAPANRDLRQGDARIVVATSLDGRLWSFPRAIDNYPGRGHQFMPAIAYAGGRLQVVYYDLREDASGFFEQYVDDLSIMRLPAGTVGRKRHTLDVRTAQAGVGAHPQFASYSVTAGNPSRAASQYLVGSRPGSTLIEQLQFNPPNLPLFALGSAPFIGDYIDVAARAIVPASGGGEGWRFSRPGDEPVFHLVWADNRDVRPPADGNWQNYTPPATATSGGASVFDPTLRVQACVPGQAGMRNQNIYTSRVSSGLVAGSPMNDKPLSTSLQRAFVVFAQNTTDELAAYRFTIANQPPGGTASFLQFSSVTQLDVLIAPRSSAARTVYVTSTDANARIDVDIRQVAAAGVPPPPAAGRHATVVLNPDITNPDIANPDITNPGVANPDIANVEVHNPDIANPDITNPDITNPDITNPDITNPDITNITIVNPDITNPDIANPDIANPDITNPDIANPDITNPDIANGSITDYTYTVTNNGNTTSQYALNLAVAQPVPGSVKTQVVVHKPYETPVVDGCNLKVQTQNQVVANITEPEFVPAAELGDVDPTDGGVSNITFWLQPAESLKVTVRVVDTNRHDEVTFVPTEELTVATVSAAVDSDAAAEGVRTPEVEIERPASVPVGVVAGALPPGVAGTTYEQPLTANGGSGGYVWSDLGGFPPSLTVTPTGSVVGTLPAAGVYATDVAVADAADPANRATARLTLTVVAPLIVATDSLAGGRPGVAYEQQLTAEGGTGSATWTLAEGSLPEGLALSPTGVIAGTPASAGTWPVTVRASDSGPPAQSAVRALSITVAAAVDPNCVAGVGAFFETSSMTRGRRSQAQVALDDGRVLLAGSDNFDRTAELFDPATDSFTPTGSLGSGRCYGCAAVTLPDGRVLVAGGWTGSAVLATAEIYDPATGAFTATSGQMTAARLGPSATLLPTGKVLIVGGHNGSTPIMTAELYDPATDSFTATGLPTTGRLAPAVRLADGRVLRVGGMIVGGSYTTSAEIYDPATGTFRRTAGEMSVGRHGASLALLADGRVLVVGGSSNSRTVLQSAEIYDPATDRFQPAGSMLEPRSDPPMLLLPDGRVLIVGGWGGNGALASTEIFDPAAGTFVAGPPLSVPRSYPGVTWLPDGRVLVAGSENNGYGISAEVLVPCAGWSVERPLSIATAALPEGSVGSAYRQTLATAGGNGRPTTWAIASGSLPPGLTLTAAGMLEGTPRSGGTWRFSVRASQADPPPQTAVRSLTLTVSGLAAYQIEDLGTAGGDTDGVTINDAGQVAGTTVVGTQTHAFLYEGGRMRDIHSSGTISTPTRINAGGTIVGGVFDVYPHERAFMYRDGVTTDLGNLGGRYRTGARGINVHGQIVGYSFITGDVSNHAFLYENGAMRSIHQLGDGSSAYAINDDGAVVGSYYRRSDYLTRAFLYRGGEMQDLGTLGGDAAEAWAINNAGHVVGNSNLVPGGPTHAFLWVEGVMRDLGTLGGSASWAWDVNSAGDVVGYVTTPDGSRAFLHSGGRMYDLNTMLPPGSGWVLTDAHGINAHGVIVGTGLHNGQRRAFVLTPVR